MLHAYKSLMPTANSNRDCFLLAECVHVGLTGQHSWEVSGT